ncbi:DUF2063 domain-containing protein [Arenimonas sp.]|uniref:HvfC family RiPP maturation protein n=1 Tax=Arenimonas sp. TaxID=1872635 RepID=UPI0039E55659
MHAPDALRAQQFELAAHLRDPVLNPAPPAIEERRLAVYRELFFNSIRDLLSGNFPVIRRLFGEERWSLLVRDFYREYRCQTPLFPEIAREFIRYLDDIELPPDAPWLRELAHYEWVELALDISEGDPLALACDPFGDLLEGAPQPSPLAWALAYAWPVHRLSEDYRPMAAPAEPTFLLVQRDDEGRVRFNQITALVFRLLQRLDEAPEISGREQLFALAWEAGAPDPQAFVVEGAAMLEQLRQARVLIGTRA